MSLKPTGRSAFSLSKFGDLGGGESPISDKAIYTSIYHVQNHVPYTSIYHCAKYTMLKKNVPTKLSFSTSQPHKGLSCCHDLGARNSGEKLINVEGEDTNSSPEGSLRYTSLVASEVSVTMSFNRIWLVHPRNLSENHGSFHPPICDFSCFSILFLVGTQ